MKNNEPIPGPRKTGLSRGVPLTAFGYFGPRQSTPSETDTSHQKDDAAIAAAAAQCNLKESDKLRFIAF